MARTCCYYLNSLFAREQQKQAAEGEWHGLKARASAQWDVPGKGKAFFAQAFLAFFSKATSCAASKLVWAQATNFHKVVGGRMYSYACDAYDHYNTGAEWDLPRNVTANLLTKEEGGRLGMKFIDHWTALTWFIKIYSLTKSLIYDRDSYEPYFLNHRLSHL